MRHGLAIALVVASVLGSAAVVAAQPDAQQLYQVCLRPSDHAARANERGVCDAQAEAAGFTHGVVQPFRCMPNEPCIVWLVCAVVIGPDGTFEDPGEHYMCVAHGRR